MTPIANFEHRYCITQQGDVINLANNKKLTAIRNPNGYLKVGLADGKGGHTQLSVHTLVAKHFLPNPYGYTQVNHRDGNDDKESYLHRVLAGEQVKVIAITINRSPETLHKMLRTTASRLGLTDQWVAQMKENHRVTAIQNLRP